MSSYLWILVGALYVAGQTQAFTHSSNGPGGEACGADDRRCLAGHAECNDVTGDCDCFNPPYHGGDGRVNCYKNNTFYTEVFNDPNVLTYNGNSIGLPLPCRYFWTHTRTYLKDRKRVRVGYCEFQAYAFHHKAKGKFYVGGYDVAIKLTYNNGTEKKMSIRKYGKAEWGNFDFTVNATDDQYLPNGMWANHPIDFHDPTTNLRIKCEYDDDNNLAIIEAKKCGIRIQFRPYDCKLKRQQPMIPHIAYGVNCAFHPEFLSQDKVVAIPPAADHGGMTIDDVLIPGLNREETLVYRALHSMAAQNSPIPNTACANSPSVMANCNDATLDLAFEKCMWILKRPRFIRCYDQTESGEEIMELFNKCIDVFCSGASCPAFIASINATGCNNMPSPYPEVTDFLSGNQC